MPVRFVKKIIILALVLAAIASPVVSRAQNAGGAAGATGGGGSSLISDIGLTVLSPITGVANLIFGDDKVCGVSCYAEKIFSQISLWVGVIVSRVAAFAITLLVSFIQVLINLSGNLTSTQMVTMGFGLTLSLANLGFVLAIIVIAFATILRIQSYAMKQLLWKLVVAALLVNFSFALVGTIIDFTNVLSNYFLVGASPNGDIAKFGDKLAESLNVQKLSLLKTDISKVNNVLKFGEGYLKMFVSIAIVVIFSIFLVITFAAVAFMMLVRHIVMIVLLILMPLAWLFWIFPGLSSHWSKWWSTFLKWAFFLPAMTFFMFLSVKSFEAMNMVVGQNANLFKVNLQSASSFLVFDESGIIVILQIIVQGGLLLGGLMVAQQMGITGANAMMSAAKGSANWITGKVGKGAMLPARIPGALGFKPAKAVSRGLANTITGTWLRKIPGAERAAAGLSAFGSRKQDVEDYKKNVLDKAEGRALENLIKASSLDPAENTARLQKAAEIKKMDWLTEGLSPDEANKKMLKLASQVRATAGPKLIKEITDNDPELAGILSGETEEAKINKAITDATTAVSAAKVSEMTTKSLRNKVVASAFTETLISGLVRSGSEEKLKALEQGLEEAAGLAAPARQQLRAGLKAVEEQAVNLRKKIKEDEETAGTPAAKAQVNALKTQLATLRKNINNALQQMQLSPEERKAYDKMQVLRQRIGNP